MRSGLWRWLTAGIVFAAGCGAILSQPLMYAAKAKLELPREEIDPKGYANIINLDRVSLNRLLPVDAVARIASPETVRKALEELGWPSDPDSVSKVARNVRARLSAGSNTIEVRVESEDGHKALALTGALISAYETVRKSNERTLIDRVAITLRRESAQMESELQQLMGEMTAARNNTPGVPPAVIARTRSELMTLELEKLQLERQLEVVRSQTWKESSSMLFLGPSGATNTASRTWLRAQRLNTESELASARQSYGPDSRIVRGLESDLQVRAADATSEFDERNVILEHRLAAVSARVESVRTQLAADLQSLLEQHTSDFTPEHIIRSLRMTSLGASLQRLGQRQREIDLYRDSAVESLNVIDPPHLIDLAGRRSAAVFISACGSVLLAVSLGLVTKKETLAGVL